ncbi:hypothetical protein MKY51_01295 [Solibacillus sp. FSL R5-0691]|uniref:hypothetical protein n=1 Tax=Solibacillus sp. FSL R5-0691 TaxID=2921653 RepID=UPI0030CC4BDE
MDSDKHKIYSHSITELVKFQHEIEALKTEADEKEIKATSMLQDVIDLRKQIDDREKEFQALGEKRYPESKIEEMMALCTDEGKLLLLQKIRVSLPETGYTEAIVNQLYTIDSEINEFIQQKFKLNFFGKMDSFISKITGTE